MRGVAMMKHFRLVVSVGLVAAIAFFGIPESVSANRRVTQETLRRMRAETQQQKRIENLKSEASRVVSLMAQEQFTKATKNFDPTLQQTLPPEKLRQTWQGLIAEAGPFKQQLENRTEVINNQRSILVTCQFENARKGIRLTFDQDQKVTGLSLIPRN